MSISLKKTSDILNVKVLAGMDNNIPDFVVPQSPGNSSGFYKLRPGTNNGKDFQNISFSDLE